MPFILLCGNLRADPAMTGDPKTTVKTDTQKDDTTSECAVKKKHGYLEYDGTGYRFVTKTVKPEKVNHVRLKKVDKPGDRAGSSNLYTIEVVEDNDNESKVPEKPAEEKPHIAVKRVESLDKTNMGPETNKEHKADVGVGVKVSESSEFMFGRGVVVERKNDSSVNPHDDGWRFRFKTNF